jgi:hypothetical protein
MPSFLLTAFHSTQNLLRFTLLIFLTLGLPFKGFTINALSIRFISILSILYLSFTQILLAFNNTLIKDFQAYWYPLEFKDQTTEDVINPWNFGFVNTFNELFSDGFRAGGIFYNPNVTGLVLVLNYIIFFISSNQVYKKNYHHKICDFFIFFITFFSIYITSSRTCIVGFLLFIILNSFIFKNLKIHSTKYIFFFLIFIISIIYLIFDKIISGFQPLSSVTIKFSIIFDYLNNVDKIGFLFGGAQFENFDNEYGFFIGALGIFGIFSLIILFSLFFNKIPVSRTLILTFLVLGAGNTVLFGYLSGTISFISLIIACSYYNDTFIDKNVVK